MGCHVPISYCRDPRGSFDVRYAGSRKILPVRVQALLCKTMGMFDGLKSSNLADYLPDRYRAQHVHSHCVPLRGPRCCKLKNANAAHQAPHKVSCDQTCRWHRVSSAGDYTTPFECCRC